MSVKIEGLASVTPDQQRITNNNKTKKITSSLVLGKEPIIDTVNPIKRAQDYTVIDLENLVNIKHLKLFRIKKIIKVIPMKIIFILIIHELEMIIV